MLEPCAPPCFPLTRHATPLSSLRLGAWEERTCSDQILRDRVEKGVPLLLPELSALLSEGTLRHSGALEGTVWVLQSMHMILQASFCSDLSEHLALD